MAPRRHSRKEKRAEPEAPAKRGRARAARPRGLVWTGSVSFGLVNIPVSLQSGETTKDLSFSLLDKRDHSPVGYKKINKTTGEEVSAREIVKGYEYEDGRWVTLTEADFKRASPERTQRIDLVAFAEPGSIDPVYFSRPYYLEPAPKSEKAYALLREAMRRAGKVGIGRVVLRAREHVCAVIPRGPALALVLLRYREELRDPEELHLPGDDLGALGVTDAELDMAEKLVGGLSGPFRPERFKDEYREELLAFIEKKAKAGETETVSAPEKPEPGTPPADIMTLLKKSLAATAPGRGAGGAAASRHLH